MIEKYMLLGVAFVIIVPGGACCNLNPKYRPTTQQQTYLLLNIMVTEEKKSVRFESAPIFYEASERVGKAALWMSKREYRDIRAYEKNLMQQVCQGLFVEGDQDSFRGLEVRIMPEKRPPVGVQEVFLEQSAQISLGYYNEQSIARIYAQCTRQALRLAQNMAKKDARIAAAIHQEKDRQSRSFELFRIRPSGVLKKAKSFRDSFTPPRLFRRHNSTDSSSAMLDVSPGAMEAISIPSSEDATIEGTQECQLNSDNSMTSPNSVTDAPPSIPSSSDQIVSLDLEKSQQSAHFKTVYIPSQFPFVGEPPQLASYTKLKNGLKNSKSPAIHVSDSPHHCSPRWLKRPSLDMLLLR